MNSTSLATFKESTQVLVKKIQSDSKTQIRSLGLGVGIGSSLEILRNRSGDIVLAQNNNRISLDLYI